MNPTEPKPQTPLTDAVKRHFHSRTLNAESYEYVYADFARSLELKLQEAEARVVELESAESQPDLNEPPQPGFTHKVAAESRLNYIRILLVKLQEAERQRDEVKERVRVMTRNHIAIVCKVVAERDQLIKVVDESLGLLKRLGLSKESSIFQAYSLLPHVQAKKGTQ